MKKKRFSIILALFSLMVAIFCFKTTSYAATVIKDVNNNDVLAGKGYKIKINTVYNDALTSRQYYAYDRIRDIGNDYVKGTTDIKGAQTYHINGKTFNPEEIPIFANIDVTINNGNRFWNLTNAGGFFPHGEIDLSSSPVPYQLSPSGWKKNTYRLLFNNGSKIMGWLDSDGSFAPAGNGDIPIISFIPA